MKPYFKPQLVVMPVRCHVLFGFFFLLFFLIRSFQRVWWKVWSPEGQSRQGTVFIKIMITVKQF